MVLESLWVFEGPGTVLGQVLSERASAPWFLLVFVLIRWRMPGMPVLLKM
jgi:hypothetical protein